ncbi:hypothetical protein HDE_09528 [Halotydeus destructor]|nr:hypothetical protein HDE_09528 [Halotydeus destructor]
MTMKLAIEQWAYSYIYINISDYDGVKIAFDFMWILIVELVYGSYANVTAIFLYHVMLVTIRLVNEEFIATCLRSRSVDANQQRLSHVNNLKRLFDNTMSYYASVWFFGLFANFVTLAMSLTKASGKFDDLAFGHLVSTTGDFLIVVSIVLHVDYADRRAENLHIQLEDQMNGTESQALRSLVDKIGSSYKLNVSVWSMFKIDRSTILTFTSAVVTFTVLFSQLAP